MKTTLEFDPTPFSKEVLRLILATAGKLGCSPQEAVNHLLDQVAAKAGFVPGELQPA